MAVVPLSAMIESEHYLEAAVSSVAVSGALLVAIERGEVYWLVELTDSSEVVSERYGEAPFRSLGRGFYQARLASVDAIEAAASDRRYALEGLSFGAQLVEGAERAFSRLVATSPHLLRNCTARVVLAGAPDVPPDDWWSFTGRLLSWEMKKPGAWALRFGVDDLPLRRKT